MDSGEELFREVPTPGGKKWDNTSADPAFKKDGEVIAVNCFDIKRKPAPQLKVKRNKGNNDILISPQELMVPEEEFIESKEKCIASIREKSIREKRKPRTDEWHDVWYEHKNTHYKCEYCGEASAIPEAHDILPYYRLTEGQRHDRDFLKQNLISLCHEHHHNVAHLGDPDCIEFEPRIREICEQKKQEDRRRWEEENKEELELWREEREREEKRLEELRSYVKKLPRSISVEKMIPCNKRRY